MKKKISIGSNYPFNSKKKLPVLDWSVIWNFKVRVTLFSEDIFGRELLPTSDLELPAYLTYSERQGWI